MNKKYFNDIVLAIAILLTSLIVYLVFNLGVNGVNLTAEVWYEDKIVKKINLANQEKTKRETVVLNDAGEYIIVEYKHNAIRVVQAPCYNKSCINQGWTDSVNKPIICLDKHYKIIIKSNYSDFDVVVG